MKISPSYSSLKIYFVNNFKSCSIAKAPKKIPKIPAIPARAFGAGIGSLRILNIAPTIKPVRSERSIAFNLCLPS